MYVHFQKRKMQLSEGLTDFRQFLIVPNAFLAPVELTAEVLRTLAPQSHSKATTKALLVFLGLILKREITCIGQPNYASCSVIRNLMNPKK